MRKYWYYTYKTINSVGSGICCSDDGEFDIVARIKFLEKKYSLGKGTIVVIDNWKEISSTQYEKLNSYFDEMNKRGLRSCKIQNIK